jgi:hypothetical protein
MHTAAAVDAGSVGPAVYQSCAAALLLSNDKIAISDLITLIPYRH